MALWWLYGGFDLALGGFARLFEVRSSKFKVQGSVALKRRGVPIGLHRASRSALIARTTFARSSCISAPIQRPLTLRARTTGTSFSTSSTSRILPSAWRSAENALFGVKRLLQASRPLSSATNFIMEQSHCRSRVLD